MGGVEAKRKTEKLQEMKRKRTRGYLMQNPRSGGEIHS